MGRKHAFLHSLVEKRELPGNFWPQDQVQLSMRGKIIFDPDSGFTVEVPSFFPVLDSDGKQIHTHFFNQTIDGHLQGFFSIRLLHCQEHGYHSGPHVSTYNYVSSLALCYSIEPDKETHEDQIVLDTETYSEMEIYLEGLDLAMRRRAGRIDLKHPHANSLRVSTKEIRSRVTAPLDSDLVLQFRHLLDWDFTEAPYHVAPCACVALHSRVDHEATYFLETANDVIALVSFLLANVQRVVRVTLFGRTIEYENGHKSIHRLHVIFPQGEYVVSKVGSRSRRQFLFTPGEHPSIVKHICTNWYSKWGAYSDLISVLQMVDSHQVSPYDIVSLLHALEKVFDLTHDVKEETYCGEETNRELVRNLMSMLPRNMPEPAHNILSFRLKNIASLSMSDKLHKLMLELGPATQSWLTRDCAELASFIGNWRNDFVHRNANEAIRGWKLEGVFEQVRALAYAVLFAGFGVDDYQLMQALGWRFLTVKRFFYQSDEWMREQIRAGKKAGTVT